MVHGPNRPSPARPGSGRPSRPRPRVVDADGDLDAVGGARLSKSRDTCALTVGTERWGGRGRSGALLSPRPTASATSRSRSVSSARRSGPPQPGRRRGDPRRARRRSRRIRGAGDRGESIGSSSTTLRIASTINGEGCPEEEAVRPRRRVDDVLVGVEGRQHDHARRIGPPVELRASPRAVDPRHPDVHEHHVGPQVGRQPHALPPSAAPATSMSPRRRASAPAPTGPGSSSTSNTPMPWCDGCEVMRATVSNPCSTNRSSSRRCSSSRRAQLGALGEPDQPRPAPGVRVGPKPTRFCGTTSIPVSGDPLTGRSAAPGRVRGRW